MKDDTNPLRILLVEDDPEDFRLTRDTLARVRGLMYELQWAQTHAEGLSALRDTAFDVCLLDHELDGHDSNEFVRDAIHHGFDAPIIMLSSGTSRDHGLAALRAGAADYLIKSKLQPAFLHRAISYACERKRSEKEVLELEKQLMYSQKMKALGQLARNVAHDLSNVISGITGHLELIREASKDLPEIQHSVLQALASCERATQLSEHLTVSSSSDVQLNEEINLQQIVLETVDFLSRILPKNVTVTTALDRQNQLCIQGNTSQIRQALVNLALNAQEAMPEGGTLQFRFSIQYVDEPPMRRSTLKPGRYVKLDVRDSGSGIEGQYLDKIFDPSFTTKRNEKSLGMGLTTVYSILDSHLGWIEVSSETGKGSTFSLYFPLDAKPAEYAYSTPRKQTREGKGLILLVDDEVIIVELMKLYLEAAGYATKGFTDPAEALAWYSSFADQVDLVILDLMMPEVSGKDLFLMIKRISPDAKVAVISGYLDKFGQELLDLGAIKFFQKPLRYPMIISWISEIIPQTKLPRSGNDRDISNY